MGEPLPMAEVKEQEPTIEEILESIRQIISEDAETAEKPEPELKVKTSKETIIKSDLSLTPKPEAPIAPSTLSLAPEAKKPIDGKYIAPLDLTDKIEPAPVEKAPAAPAPMNIVMMDSPMTDKDNLA